MSYYCHSTSWGFNAYQYISIYIFLHHPSYHQQSKLLASASQEDKKIVQLNDSFNIVLKSCIAVIIWWFDEFIWLFMGYFYILCLFHQLLPFYAKQLSATAYREYRMYKLFYFSYLRSLLWFIVVKMGSLFIIKFSLRSLKLNISIYSDSTSIRKVILQILVECMYKILTN